MIFKSTIRSYYEQVQLNNKYVEKLVHGEWTGSSLEKGPTKQMIRSSIKHNQNVLVNMSPFRMLNYIIPGKNYNKHSLIN